MIRSNNKYQVLTPNGFSDFNGIQKISRRGYCSIILKDESSLKCSLGHLLLVKDKWYVRADKLEITDTILTDSGYKSIRDIKINRRTKENFYDLLDVEKDRQYFTNGILSHNCEFLGSSNTLIDGSVLRRLVIKTPIHDFPNLKVYDEPIKEDKENNIKEHLYLITVDTARGDNNDYSAFVVFDITEVPYSVVAVYRNDGISTLLYPNVIYEAAKYYNNCFCVVETNDLGQQVADILFYDLEYENVIMTKPSAKVGVEIAQGYEEGATTAKLGVRTTKLTKRVGCSNLKTLVEGNKLLVNDFDIVAELSRFALHGTSYKAQEGNDDLAMNLVIFSWFMIQPFATQLTDLDIRKNILNDNRKRIEDEVAPLGEVTYGWDDPEETKDIGARSLESWLMDD